MTGGTPHTRAHRAGVESDPLGSVMPPMYLSANYAFHGLGEPGPYDYARAGNPTRDVLADAMTTLEGGAGAVITGTGLGAISTIAHTLLGPGDTVVIPHDAYGGTWRLFDQLSRRGHLRLVLCNLTDLDATAACLAAESPRLVFAETPSNPLLRITDLTALSDLAHRHGATVVADNTFCSPVLQRPLEHGCDLVVHSTTKYVNGHSDVLGGAVVAKDAAVVDELAFMANTLGHTAGVFDSWMTMRGLRTLRPRMLQHENNALAVVEALTGHPAVKQMWHPSLPDHPGHEVARRQQDGFGAMVSFDLGGREAAQACVEGLQFVSLAESLGGTESLIAHPVSMTHGAMTPEAQSAAGLTPGLLRMSVGLEDADDLVADLTAGLDRAADL